MRNALTILLVLALAAGGYYWYQDRDARYAHKVMDCMYEGSFEAIDDSLSPKARETLNNPAIKPQIAQAGAQLEQVYGEIKTVKLDSRGPVEGPYAQMFGADSMQKKFTATSDKGTFDLTLVQDKDGKLLTMYPGKLTPPEKTQ